MLVITEFIFLSSLFWADTACTGGYMTRLFPRGPSRWAFPVRLVRCPEKTLPSPSCRIYIWQLFSGSRVWEEAGVQIFNPSVFLESHGFQHSDLQYLDSPCISSSNTRVYCLWKLNLLSFTTRRSWVATYHGEGGSGGKGNLPASTPFSTYPPASAPPLLSLPEHQEHQFLPWSSVSTSLWGSPHSMLAGGFIHLVC